MKKFTRTLGWFLFLSIRGLLLWVLVPVAALSWLCVHSWLQGATLRQSICWYEMNVNLVIARGLLRPFLGSEVRSARFVTLSQMGVLPPHKIHLLLTAI